MSETQGSGINHKLYFFISGFYLIHGRWQTELWRGGAMQAEHRRGTLEQGSKAPKAHIGPCIGPNGA